MKQSIVIGWRTTLFFHGLQEKCFPQLLIVASHKVDCGFARTTINRLHAHIVNHTILKCLRLDKGVNNYVTQRASVAVYCAPHTL